MDASTSVAVAAALLAAVVAVAVPWFTFRLALRQDHVRWMRDQRAALYLDMLGEACAEQEWLRLETASRAVQERARASFTDKRMPPAERARLGDRGTLFASQTVSRLFTRFNAEAHGLLLASRLDNDPDAGQMMVNVRLGELIDELRQAVRRELGTDRVSVDGSREDRPAAAPGA